MNKNIAEVEAKVKEIVVDHLDILVEDYDVNASLADSFGADSLDLWEMVLEAEKIFEIEIPEDRMADIKTPRDFINIVSNQLNGNGCV